MRAIDIERMKAHGLNPTDFEPSSESTTIDDLVEALDILTSIVLGDDQDG